MVRKKMVIGNKLGLHARAAVKFVNLANRYNSRVRIVKDGSEIDGKSILGILTLAATRGSSVTLKVAGRDERQALEALANLIRNKFEETE
ncbi:MAG: HPr family phosphocarrier protein [Candidatus Aminicenantes bacterium]|nr:HPr family phosphocarrier protein [Candidatus Aminicenantes bacterium]